MTQNRDLGKLEGREDREKSSQALGFTADEGLGTEVQGPWKSGKTSIIPWSSSFTGPFHLTLSFLDLPFLSPFPSFPFLSLILTFSYLLCPCGPCQDSGGGWGVSFPHSVLHCWGEIAHGRGSVGRLCNGSSAERREVGKTVTP